MFLEFFRASMYFWNMKTKMRFRPVLTAIVVSWLLCSLPMRAQTIPVGRIVAQQQECFHTTGRGNTTPVVRIRITNNTGCDAELEGIEALVDDGLVRNADSLYLLCTPAAEFFADEHPMLVAQLPLRRLKKQTSGHMSEDSPRHYKAVLKATPGRFCLPKGECYLWIAARVKPRAALAENISAEAEVLHLRIDGRDTTLNASRMSTQCGGHGVRIFDRQRFVYVPTDDGCRFYRIPAMTLNAEGDIVIAADRRYDSNADLGQHKIDVSVRSSRDGGHTWTDQQIIACGDGLSDDKYGYGDAALVRTVNGRLLCLMAASSKWAFHGIRHIAMCVSDDGGRSWSEPRDITRQNFTDAVHGLHNEVGFFSLFCTSGRALCTADGRIMVAVACLNDSSSHTFSDYILQSSDDGESWIIGKECAFHEGDEAKLVQLNDSSILISVRRQRGNRGFNRVYSDATGWQQQYEDASLPANACNADVLYYSRHSEGGPDIMLHTGVGSPDRHGLQLWMSIDEGRSWHLIDVIQHGGAAYSTMERLRDGSLAILFEDDSYDAGNGYHINFLTLTYKQILRHYNQLRRRLKRE